MLLCGSGLGRVAVLDVDVVFVDDGGDEGGGDEVGTVDEVEDLDEDALELEEEELDGKAPHVPNSGWQPASQ